MEVSLPRAIITRFTLLAINLHRGIPSQKAALKSHLGGMMFSVGLVLPSVALNGVGVVPGVPLHGHHIESPCTQLRHDASEAG